MSIIEALLQLKRPPSVGKFLSRKLVPTTYTEVWIKSPTGPRVYAHIHRPVKDGEYPAVVFVPGGLSAGLAYDKGTEVTADDVASLGLVALHYDPSGRGRTGGEEDHWGPRHQGELAAVLEYIAELPCVSAGNIGVFSFSIGITTASGALATHSLPFVKYLYDWEGPSNRFNITKNDTHAPLKDFPSSNLEFWKDREAVKFIGGIECGYFRYQSGQDHVQGIYKGHAVELVNLATAGRARWTRLNDNPMNTRVDAAKVEHYMWVPRQKDHKGQLLKYLLEIQALE